MAIPAIKALHSLGHDVDVLIGNMSDDKGAHEVLAKLRDTNQEGIIKNIWLNSAPGKYDLAIMSIPFDGRWHNGVHFNADKVVDGRTRPDPSTTGLVSWKRHEIEYQMDNIIELGYVGSIPTCTFTHGTLFNSSKFYLGIGYKKDALAFWKKKHWGNENYAKLVSLILADNENNTVVTTGDLQDTILSIAPISRMVNNKRFTHLPGGLLQSFKEVSECHMYVGNDTGMMHVAAAEGRKVLGLFFLENSITKSHPWGFDCQVIDGVNRTVTPEEVFNKIKEMSK